MKFRFILTFILLAGSATTRGYLLEESELSPASEYSGEELKRYKRTLTTICVEIKPSSPYEQPYFMCKGTDTPQSPKGSSYSGSGSQSSKPSYKPSVSYGESESYQSGLKGGYHTPPKTSYQPEHMKYGTPYESPPRPAYVKKPSYSDPESHSSYSSYENPKLSYGVKQYDSHDSHDDYSKPSVHSPVHISSSKPHDYRPSTYSSSDSAEYSKPSSYGQSSSYNHKPAHEESSYSKAPHGISTATQSSSYDGKYPSVNSYSFKPTSYEHAGHQGYNPPKSSYGAQSAQKPYSKPTYNPSPTYNKPDYHDDHSKPSTPDYHHQPSYSSNPQTYRGMSEDMMMPMWDSQQHEENPQFLSTGNPMDYYGMDTPRSMEQEQQQYQPGPGMNMDYVSYEQSGPQLQAASPTPAPAYDPYIQPVQYAPAIPSYQPAVPSAVITPQYGSSSPTYTPYIPVSYPSAPISYAPTLPIQAYQHPIHLLRPSCPQSYLYSLQPTIISLPCLSSESVGTNIGAPHQFYQTNINPLHDVPGGRSSISETDKTTPDNSTSAETEEVDKRKLETEKESTPTKQEPPKTAAVTNEKPKDKKTDQAVVKEKPKEDQNNPAAVTNQPEDGGTKVAYEAMVKMAKLAAQLKKDPEDE